jgi:outer membrane protein
MFFVAVVLLVLGGWNGSALAEQKIKLGFVQLERVFEGTARGKEIREKLFAIRKEKEAMLSGKQEAFNQARQDFQQKAFTLSATARLDKEQELRQKELELKNLSEAAMQEFQLERRKLEAIFFRDLRDVISQLGEEGGFTAILDRDTLLWATSAIDISDSVIKAFNEQGPR